MSERSIESKRSALTKRATQAKENVRKGRYKSGSAKDLLADLND